MHLICRYAIIFYFSIIKLYQLMFNFRIIKYIIISISHNMNNLARAFLHYFLSCRDRTFIHGGKRLSFVNGGWVTSKSSDMRSKSPLISILKSTLKFKKKE